MTKPRYLPHFVPKTKQPAHLRPASASPIVPDVVSTLSAPFDPEQLVHDLLAAPSRSQGSLLAKIIEYRHVKQTRATAAEWAGLLKETLGILDTRLQIEESHHQRALQRVRHAVERAHAQELAELHVEAEKARLKSKIKRHSED